MESTNQQTNRSFIDRITDWAEQYYRFLFVLGMGLVIFLCFYRLSVHYVVSWDEARFGINAYEMLKSGNFIMNTFRYEPDYWNLKPPLSMWGTALSFLIFGYNKLGLRAFSAACYVVLTALAARFVEKRFGKLQALLTILFLCANTACFSFHMIRSGDSDSLYLLFYTLSMFCMLMIRERPRMLYGAGFFFACAFLTKSWHAGTIVFVGFFFLLLTGEIKTLKGKRLLAFLASFLIPMGLWAILRFTQDGTEFFKEMIFYELLTSSQEAIENHQQEFLFYVKNYFVTTWRQYIYLAALLIGGAGLIGYRKRLKEEGRSYLAVGFFLWALMPILWFSIAATKLIWYSYATLIPILIGAGIVAGTAVRDRNISAGLRTAAFVGVLVLTGYFITGNVQNIRAEYGNDFHDFFAEANEAAPDYAGIEIYLGADGDFGYGNWSQNTSFLAEIAGDHVCMDGGVEAFVQTKEPAVLVTNRDYYAQYADVLMDKTVVYENEKYLYISNDL